MVTQFNRKDLVSFGNYLLHLVTTEQKHADPSGALEVSHADLENWLFTKTNEKTILSNIQTMCEESLDPETFEEWEKVKEALIKTRICL